MNDDLSPTIGGGPIDWPVRSSDPAVVFRMRVPLYERHHIDQQRNRDLMAELDRKLYQIQLDSTLHIIPRQIDE